MVQRPFFVDLPPEPIAAALYESQPSLANSYARNYGMADPVSMTALGMVPHSGHLWPWLIKIAVEAAKRIPDMIEKIEKLPDSLHRLGDLIVWEGPTGTKVIAGMSTFAESQQRIETAVSGIESAQLAMSSTLGTVQALSLATFGVTSLSAAFMVWRLRALNKRLDHLSRQVADIEARLDARDRALLDGSLNFLHEYERKNRASDLEQALIKARDSAATYGRLAGDESEGQKRLPVMNYYGRCYLLSLLTELRCMAFRDDNTEAVERVEKEKSRLHLLVDTTYQQTLAKAPELFLSPSLASSGVTFELMTDVYQQLQNAEVLKDVEIRDACDLFEHLRGRIFQEKSRFWMPFHRAKTDCLHRLRYMISCVEDCNRIRSMGLLIQHAETSKVSLQNLSEQVQKLRPNLGDSGGQGQGVGAFAYRFA